MFCEEWNHIKAGSRRSDEDGVLYLIAPCRHGPIRNQKNPFYRVKKSYEADDSPLPDNTGVAKYVDIINTEWWYMSERDEWHCCLGGANACVGGYPAGSLLADIDQWRNRCPFRQSCRMKSAEARSLGLLS